jgi:hypothetical protein
MMRQMDSGLSRLERRQAAREKAETEMLHPAAMERAGRWFREAEAPQVAPSPEPTETSDVSSFEHRLTQRRNETIPDTTVDNARAAIGSPPP